jgi:hypothetical protein
MTVGIANMFFVLILLWIAIATIFDFQPYTARQLLVRLIIAALLINFSLAIAGAFINLSNGIARIFYDALRRVEPPAVLALLDDALGQPRAHSREPGELRGVSAVDVERLGRWSGGGCRGRRTGRRGARGRAGPRRRRRRDGGGRRRRIGEQRGRVVPIETLETLRRVGESGAPLAHPEPHEQGEGQQDQQPELRDGVEHTATVPLRPRAD